MRTILLLTALAAVALAADVAGNVSAPSAVLSVTIVHDPVQEAPTVDLDIDGNATVDALTDGVLVVRYLFGLRGAALIANAVAHTESGGTIAVSAVNTGGRVEIAVDDDGPGVPEALRGRVFDRFARLDESRSSTQGGSGLGLAIVKAIAEAHGGSVACLTSPLGGARFVVSLPSGR